MTDDTASGAKIYWKTTEQRDNMQLSKGEMRTVGKQGNELCRVSGRDKFSRDK